MFSFYPAVIALIVCLFSRSANAQDLNCGSQSQTLTYTLCLERNADFKRATCDQFPDADMRGKCDCYYNANLLLCYEHCLNEEGPAGLKAALTSSLPGTCAAVGLTDVANLPCPAPYVSHVSFLMICLGGRRTRRASLVCVPCFLFNELYRWAGRRRRSQE